MRSFASLAILVLAASVSTNSAENPLAEVKSEARARIDAPIYDEISSQTHTVIEFSKRLGKVGSAVMEAVEKYGDDFQKKAAEREVIAAKYGDKVAMEQEKKLRDLMTSIHEAKAEHEKAKRDLARIKGMIPSLVQQKRDNDAAVTKEIKLLNVAAEDMKKANAVVAQVEGMVTTCSKGEAPHDLAAALEEMRAAAKTQSEAISDVQKDVMLNKADAEKFASLQDTFSDFSKFAVNSNNLLGKKRIAVPSAFLEEAASASVGLRINAGARVEPEEATPEEVASATKLMEELRDSIGKRALEIRAGLEKLSTVKYTDTNVAEVVTPHEQERLKKKMARVKEQENNLRAIRVGTKATEEDAEKEAKLGEEDIKELKRLIRIQENDIELAVSKAGVSQAAAAKAMAVADTELAKAKECKAEADRIKVELAALECIKGATDKVLGEELAQAEADRTETNAEVERLQAGVESASDGINLHLRSKTRK